MTKKLEGYKGVPIYERLEPKEALVLEKGRKGITVIRNEKGKPILEFVDYPLETEDKKEESKVSKGAKRKIRLMKALASRGIKDALILKPDTAKKVLTEKRIELVRTIKDEEVTSIKELSEKVDRKVEAVHRDLKILQRNGVVTFIEKGGRKNQN